MNGIRWVAVATVLAAGVNTPAVVTTTQTGKAAALPVVSLTGVIAPTNEADAAPGSLMSTYGHLTMYDATGKATPLVNRFVYVETRRLSAPAAPYEAISTGRTTATGYYYANWRIDTGVDVRVSFVSGSTSVPSKITYFGTIQPQPRPTWLDGVARPAGPTTAIRLDTKMSAFGHLRVLYGNGQVGPYAGQRVRVQLQEAVEPLLSGPGFDTVGKAVTTSTGYFFTNWTPSRAYFRNTDVRVRLLFAPGYRTVSSSMLDLGVIHVQ